MNQTNEGNPYFVPGHPVVDRGDWMQTFTGLKFYPTDPRPEEVCIEDIAHALSQLCRFAGHCRKFYSVAQHSVIVSRLVGSDPALRLAALLHDATEAYYVDIPRPLKVALPEYKAIEHRLETIIKEKFGVDFSDPRIKHADNIALVTEARDLLGPHPVGWSIQAEPIAETINPVRPSRAEEMFMDTFYFLAL